MKKFMLCMVIFFLLITAAFGDEIYITTIKSTSIDKVKSTLLYLFTTNKYTVKSDEANRIVFLLKTGDGVFTPLQRFSVYCELEQKGDCVILNVSKKLAQGFFVKIEDTKDIAPLIKSAKNQIDGTPIEYIANEAEGSTEWQSLPEKKLGLVLEEKEDNASYYSIKSIEPYSVTADSPLHEGDKIFEINAKPVSDMSKQEVETILAQKWEEGSSLMILYEHDGTRDLAILKKGKEVNTSAGSCCGNVGRKRKLP